MSVVEIRDYALWSKHIHGNDELKEELIEKGHQFRSHSDTEVIVHLYEEEGEQFVNRLRGMFAIALWDQKVKKLLLYRDRVGIKPLHYWHQNGTLVFASEIKAILKYPEVSREISPLSSERLFKLSLRPNAQIDLSGYS